MAQLEVQDLELRARRRCGADKWPLGLNCCLGLCPTAPELLAQQANVAYGYVETPRLPSDQHDA